MQTQSAKVLLDYSLKVREQFGLAEHIRELEAIIKAREEADKRRGAQDEEE